METCSKPLDPTLEANLVPFLYEIWHLAFVPSADMNSKVMPPTNILHSSGTKSSFVSKSDCECEAVAECESRTMKSKTTHAAISHSLSFECTVDSCFPRCHHAFVADSVKLKEISSWICWTFGEQ